MSFCSIEFWINRYQTLISALLAIVGIYFATRPVWQQVGLMEAEREDVRLKGLKEQYDTLSKAMDLIDPLKWPDEVEAIPHPEIEPIEDHENRCRAAFDQRKRVLGRKLEETVALVLPPEPRAVIVKMRDDLRKAMDEYTWESSYQRRKERSLVIPGANVTELWFWCVDQPDRMIINRMRTARDRLDAFRLSIVDELSNRNQKATT